MILSKKELEICVHHFLTNARSFNIDAIYISAFHNIMKNWIKGVFRVCTVRPQLGVFSEFKKINIFVSFVSQLVRMLRQWSLYEDIKDILPYDLNTKRVLSDIWLLSYKQNCFGCFCSEFQFFQKWLG